MGMGIRQRLSAIGPVAVLAIAFVLGAVNAQAAGTKSIRDATGKTVVVPATVPDKADLTPTANVVINDELILVTYSRAGSERPYDYGEFYDLAGHLLAIGWFDAKGQAHLVRDANLGVPGAKGPAGVFVEARVGNPA